MINLFYAFSFVRLTFHTARKKQYGFDRYSHTLLLFLTMIEKYSLKNKKKNITRIDTRDTI